MKYIDSPVIKLFIVDNKYYMYDPIKNIILQITKMHYNEILELQEIGISNYLSNKKQNIYYHDIISLFKKGFFRDYTVIDIKHQSDEILDTLINRFSQDLILQVTQDCNFKCRYCLFANDTHVERHHNKINMEFEIAQKAIDYLYNHSMDADVITIGFYGGEPLLNYQLIQKATEYVKNKFQLKKIKFLTTINGSLLTDKIIDFLVENDFELNISLDGDKEYQDAHRKFAINGKNTFEIVKANVIKIKNKNLEYFENNVTFNSVIFNDENEEKVYSFFNSLGIHKDRVSIISANLNGIDYFSSPTLLFLENKIDNVKESSKFETFLKKMDTNRVIPEVDHPNGQCVPGVRRLYVTINGDLFPCEKIVENTAFCMGNINNDFIDIEKARKILNSAKISETYCKKCWAFRFCEMCISHSLSVSSNGFSQETKLLHCDRQKKEILDKMKLYVQFNGGKEI